MWCHRLASDRVIMSPFSCRETAVINLPGTQFPQFWPGCLGYRRNSVVTTSAHGACSLVGEYSWKESLGVGNPGAEDTSG